MQQFVALQILSGSTRSTTDKKDIKDDTYKQLSYFTLCAHQFLTGGHVYFVASIVSLCVANTFCFTTNCFSVCVWTYFECLINTRMSKINLFAFEYRKNAAATIIITTTTTKF